MLSLYARFAEDRVDVAESTLGQYEIAARLFDRWAGHDVPADETTADLLRGWMREQLRQGRAERTVNNKRQAILTLWGHAHDERLTDVPPPRVRRLREPRHEPRAYTVDEVSRLLAVARRAETIRKGHRRWTPQHWTALILVVYDTSLRIGCLLAVPRTCVTDDATGHWLAVPPRLQKQRRETRQRLHPQTVRAIADMHRAERFGVESDAPLDPRLFAWPLHERAIWQHFKLLLAGSGLPYGRRDLFHRLRRTSYSYVAKELGIDAATEHAGHAGDLSRCYLDRSLLERPQAVDVLPRPA